VSVPNRISSEENIRRASASVLYFETRMIKHETAPISHDGIIINLSNESQKTISSEKRMIIKKAKVRPRKTKCTIVCFILKYAIKNSIMVYTSQTRIRYSIFFRIKNGKLKIYLN